jgi:hypothetical protein
VTVGTGFLDVGPRDHVVQFYHHDEELAETVCSYLLGAVQDGGVAIVIATEAHRLVFDARLAAAGVDVAAARAGGAYRVFDAAETMSRFLVAGAPDRVAFEDVIGGVVQEAAAGGRPVRAYGEMVALLWDAGLVTAAIELEALWNDLGRQHPFSLLCAYPADSVDGEGNGDSFDEVCRLHAAATFTPGGPAVETRGFAGSRGEPRAARHFAEETLRRWGAGDDLIGDIAIVVTELATNAVAHAESDFTVTLRAHGGAVRVGVRDGKPLPMTSGGELALPADPGHGLGVIAVLARRWGAGSVAEGGKDVWAEIETGLPSASGSQSASPARAGLE